MYIGGGTQTNIESTDDCFRCHRRNNCDHLNKLEYKEDRKQYVVNECSDMEPLNDDELAQRIGK